MAEVISISKDNDYIIINSSGKPSLDELKNAIDEVLKIYEAKGIDRVFVNSTSRSQIPTTMELAQGAAYLSKKCSSKLRFAILVSELGDSHSEFRLVTGIQFGLVNYFTDETEAIKWLKNSC